jgi:tRNA threonylcarbamoyladenosine biosynthesis protein TsaB
MNLLAIDSSTELASVALSVDGVAAACIEQESAKMHARLLLPMIEQLMAEAGVGFSQLDAIVFGCGPGSFTGLRITCSLAKGLAYAHDLNLIPVSSLAAIVWSAREQLGSQQVPVLAVLDARMHELYWAYYESEQYLAEHAVNKAQGIIVNSDRPLVLAGYGIDLYKEQLPQSINSQIIKQLDLVPKASAMIGLAQSISIKSVSAAEAQPVYVRNKVTQGD